MSPIQEILDFWFLPSDHEDYGKKREEWFQKNSDFDQEIRHRFLEHYEQATAGYLLDWSETPLGCLALILLFDQFSRNMFRDTPRAFSTDHKALEIARYAITRGFLDELDTNQKRFIALPFEHSENMTDQKKSIALFESFNDENGLDYARQHYDIVKRFGRYPHRNAILGRTSTEEEACFLTEPGSSF
jgi:uncharacterized protein (DUF924 family)